MVASEGFQWCRTSHSSFREVLSCFKVVSGGVGWFWIASGWFWMVSDGFRLVTGGFGWMRVVSDGFGWFAIILVTMQ